MIRKGIRPKIRLVFGRANTDNAVHEVMPFQRSWIAIAILLGMDIIFTIPAVSTFQEAAREWRQFDTLFDLVGAVFLSAWLLGWSIGPLLMTTILAMMLFGREILIAQPGAVEILIGLPGIGVAAQYDPAKMRNLRYVEAQEKSGRAWRSAHIAFDYGANTVAVGSAIQGHDFAKLNSYIEMANGKAIRHGEALKEEIDHDWEPEEATEVISTVTEASGEMKEVTLWSPSTLALIIANLMPIVGMIFFDWQLSDVMVLYWAESAIIGFFNVLKIAVIGKWMVLLAGPFFLGHFSGFMAIHFLFIYMIFVRGLAGDASAGGELAEVVLLFFELWPALVALLASHTLSFIMNFLGRHEYRGRTIKDQMSEPYSRIIFMHLVLIFGGGLVMIVGNPAPVLIAVIVVKIYFDIKAHLKQHGRRQ